MFDYNQIMALKQLVAEGEEDVQQQISDNFYKGSMLNPGIIGGNGSKK